MLQFSPLLKCTLLILVTTSYSASVEKGPPTSAAPPRRVENSPAPAPTQRPIKPDVDTRPKPLPNFQGASAPCNASLFALDQVLRVCLGNLSSPGSTPPPSMPSSVRNEWCGASNGCRNRIRNALSTSMNRCQGGSDGPQKQGDRGAGPPTYVGGTLIPPKSVMFISNATVSFDQVTSFLCPPPPADSKCDDDVVPLKEAGRQGLPTTDMLDGLCKPCAKKSIGDQMKQSGNQTEINSLALAKSLCDKVDGKYCGPDIAAFDGRKPEALCSPCFLRYFAKQGFAGDSTKNPMANFQNVLTGACYHNGTGTPCIKKVFEAMNFTTAQGAGLLTGNASFALTKLFSPCATGFDSICNSTMQAMMKKVGCCAVAIPSVLGILQHNITHAPGFQKIKFGTPCYPKTVSKTRFTITTNDTAQKVCSDLRTDLSTSLGTSPDNINCSATVLMGRRLLASSTVDVTTTVSEYQAPGAPTTTVFEPDYLQGSVTNIVSLSDATTAPETVSPMASPTASTSSGATTSPAPSSPKPSSDAPKALSTAVSLSVAVFVCALFA